MRYLLQQMIGFFTIILTVLVIFGLTFTKITKTTMKETTYQQLEGYTTNVLENSRTQNWTLADSLDTSTAVLQNQSVSFILLDADRIATYPPSFAGQKGDGFVSEEDLETFKKNGKPIQKTIASKDINGKKMTMAVHMQPLFSEPNFHFQGLMLTYQPASNIDKSVNELTQNLFKGFILSTLIALLISYILAKFQVNRINRMRSATTQIASGNFDVHLEVNNNDELDDLAEDFNQMAVSLKESQEEIQRQEERRRNFMADVAHEMRTPLTTINGLLEGIYYGAIPKDQEQKCIELMQSETNRLIRLVNENLDYEKILTNQISIVVQQLNGTKILATLVEQLSGKSHDKNNELVLLTEDNIEVWADYDRFVQVMVNIITNAIQFTENGRITIAIERGYKESVVTISDTGIGMSEEQQLNIWDRYYKADPSRKNTKYGESGLGLPIVDQLVRLHKGRIDVTSELGVGTTFAVHFPDKIEESSEEG